MWEKGMFHEIKYKKSLDGSKWVKYGLGSNSSWKPQHEMLAGNVQRNLYLAMDFLCGNDERFM